jgi:DNA-binding LacI/PurR family transcriptional regulator
MTPTIRDVAAKAGVSFQLAAAVLGEKKYARASEAARKRIADAAHELGYVPNVSARILRGDASKIIGVLIDSRAPESMYGVLAEIEHAADALGYRILIAQAHDNPEKLMHSYHALKQNGVDGIISFSHDYSELDSDFRLDRQLKDDPRIVFVRDTLEPDVSAVDVDFRSGMKQAMDHLTANGYRKTALLLRTPVPDKLPLSCHRRLDAFRSCCRKGDVLYLKSADEDVSGLEKECRQLIREKLLPGKYDSVIAHDDNLAVILMRTFAAGGIRIPQDFGLIGFDNLRIDECLPVTLSSLYFDRKELSGSVLKILLDKIAGKTEPVRIVCNMKFIPRESTSKKISI